MARNRTGLKKQDERWKAAMIRELNHSLAKNDPHLLESTIAVVNSDSLLYLPDPEDLRAFITLFATAHSKLSSEFGNAIIVVEDKLYDDKLRFYKGFLEGLVGELKEVFSFRTERIYILSYSDVIRLQNTFGMCFRHKDGGYISTVIFEDIKSITKFSDISKKIVGLKGFIERLVGLTTSPFLFYDYFMLDQRKKLTLCFTPVLYDKKTSNFYKRLVELSEIVLYRSNQGILEEDLQDYSLYDLEHPNSKRPKAEFDKDGYILKKISNLFHDELNISLSPLVKGLFDYLEENDLYDTELFLSHREIREMDVEFINLIKQNRFRSEKIIHLKRLILLMKSTRIVVIVKDLEIREIVASFLKGTPLKKIDNSRELNLDEIVDENLGKGKVNIQLVDHNNLEFLDNHAVNIVYFDYYPFNVGKNRFIFSSYEGKLFLTSILSVEEKIELELKPTFCSDITILSPLFKETFCPQSILRPPGLESEGATSPYMPNFTILTEKDTCEEILEKMRDVKFVNKVRKEENKVVIVPYVKDDIRILDVGGYLGSISGHPVYPGRKEFHPPSCVMLDITSLSFGHLSSLQSFVDPKNFLGEGVLFLNVSSILCLFFTKQSCFRIEIGLKEVDEFCVLDYTGEDLDIFLTLKVHPKICILNEKIEDSALVAKTAKGFTNVWKKMVYFDGLV
jgi:hypothetical protein